jgi:hypothetical protein
MSLWQLGILGYGKMRDREDSGKRKGAIGEKAWDRAKRSKR